MATEVVSSIRASGGDYTTLSNWEATEQRNLVTADEIAVAELYNDWTGNGLSNATEIAGWTVDSTRYIIVRAAAGNGTQGANRHSGTVDSGARVTSTGATLVSHMANTRIEKIQVTSTGNIALYLYAGNDAVVDSCIARSTFASDSGIGLRTNVASSIVNTLAVNCYSKGFYLNNAAAVASHCTAYNCDSGFVRGGASAVVKHCLGFGNSTGDFISGWLEGTDYNASGDASAPGTTNVRNISDPFVNAASGNFATAAGAAIIDAGGTTGAGVSADCIGTARPQNTNYDIGWFEYVAGGGATGTQATAWKIATQGSRETAWRVLAQGLRETAWRVATQGTQASAWRLLTQQEQAAAWHILTQAAQETAWMVLRADEQAASWAVFTRQEREAAWRILTQGATETAWKVFLRRTLQTAWKIGEVQAPARVRQFISLLMME